MSLQIAHSLLKTNVPSPGWDQPLRCILDLYNGRFHLRSLGGSPDYRERHENGFGGGGRPPREGGSGPGRYAEERYGGEDGGGRYGEASRPAGQRFIGQSGPPLTGSRGARVSTNVVVGGGAGGDGPQEGAVLMVYGLNMEKMNADRLFNLLCLYGNVFKVIFSYHRVVYSMFTAWLIHADQIPEDERRISHGPNGGCSLGGASHILPQRPRVLQQQDECQV